MGVLSYLERIEKKHALTLSLQHLDPISLAKERDLCEQSFYEFIKRAWKYVEGDREFVSGWHIEALAEHLEACFYGTIKDLVINVAPRTGKSIITSVLFPAWVWTKKPWLRFLYSSYDKRLVERDSENFSNVINSVWYQRLWGSKFSITKQTIGVVINSSFGKRQISTINSANTGHGGDFIICDDANNMKTLDSAIIREGTNLWWSGTMISRYNNPKTVCRIICQQRGHENDLSGYILSSNIPGLVHLRLPMEYSPSNPTITIPLPSSNSKPWQDPRKHEGELLWNAQLGPDELGRLKASMGSYFYSGQYNQRPAPAEGGVLLKKWFQIWEYEKLPKCSMYIQSWDTAMSTNETAAFSAQTTWGVFHDEHNVPNVILLSMWRGRLEYPELKKMIISFANDFSNMNPDLSKHTKPLNKPDIILMEAKANGLSLIQDIMRTGIQITRFDPSVHSIGASRYGSKVVRARLISPILEAGRVWVPAKPPLFNRLYNFADVFLEACASFPNLESNDIVDSMTQAMSRLIKTGFIFHPMDLRFTPKENWKNKALY